MMISDRLFQPGSCHDADIDIDKLQIANRKEEISDRQQRLTDLTVEKKTKDSKAERGMQNEKKQDGDYHGEVDLIEQRSDGDRAGCF